MEFHIKVSFLHKESETKKIICGDGFQAIQFVLKRLNSVDKDNIKGASIVYMN